MGDSERIAALEEKIRELEAAVSRAEADRSDLARAQELNRRIFEVVPGGIVHVSAEGSILSANPEAQRILGLGWDELSQRFTSDFETETLREDGSVCPVADYPVSKALATGKAQAPMVIGVRQPNQNVVWALFSAIPIVDPESHATTGAVVTFLDLTPMRTLQSRVNVADRLASIGTLAAGVAHEINNPLTYVGLNLDRLRHYALRMSSDDSPSARAINEARDGIERIASIVRDLGNLAAEERPPELVEIRDVLESSIRISKNECRYRARLSLEIGDVPKVWAQRSRLGQVFLNLIVNAAQAIPAGAVEANEIRVSAQASEGGLSVEISDTGAGIPPEVAETLFQPFVTSKPPGRGQGLGLYICHNIVSDLGGSIRVESSPGKGTTFRVELPAADGTAPLKSAAPKRARKPTQSGSRTLRILVVDDEPLIRRLFCDLLPDHEVETVHSGRAAIDAIGSREFDVIFCDVIMADLTGEDVLRFVTENKPEQSDRVVLMTGGAFTEATRRFLDGTSNTLLHKPFSAEDILALVEQYRAS